MASLLDATRSLWSSVLNAGAARKPASPPERPSRLKFAEPCATTHAVEPAPRELRDEVWWTARDYAEIRQKQRALALEHLARDLEPAAVDQLREADADLADREDQLRKTRARIQSERSAQETILCSFGEEGLRYFDLSFLCPFLVGLAASRSASGTSRTKKI